MMRLFSTFRWDMTLQFRNGLYYVSGFIILLMVPLLRLLPHDDGVDYRLVLPALVLVNLIITTFYYMGGLVLLEKAEGTLAGLVVTPLRDAEYLIAKIASLALLGVIESLIIVVLVYGVHVNLLPLVVGAFTLGACFTLLGFIAIARYDTLNTYLLPSIVLVLLLILPLIDHFGLWQSPIFYLHPVQPMLVLMRAVRGGAAGWEVGYGLLGSSLWFAVSFTWARRQFHQFVVRTAGA
jgi:fluoroquinolone transport system permease protein